MDSADSFMHTLDGFNLNLGVSAPAVRVLDFMEINLLPESKFGNTTWYSNAKSDDYYSFFAQGTPSHGWTPALIGRLEMENDLKVIYLILVV